MACCSDFAGTAPVVICMGEELVRRNSVEEQIQAGVLERHRVKPHVMIRQNDPVRAWIADHGLPHHQHLDKLALELVELGAHVVLCEHVQI